MTMAEAMPPTPAPGGTRRTLARELALVCFVLVLLVGTLLSLVSVWTVNRLEMHLQLIDMGMALERVRGEYLAGKDVGRQDRFFHGAPGSDTFPAWLRQTRPGFTRVEHDGRDWHVMVDDRGGVRYMLLRDYTAFEQKFARSHWVTVCSVGSSLLAAFLLGGVVTRRVVRPLVRLAEHVAKRPAMPSRTHLAQAYPANEIGRVAAAFDQTYNQLEAALQREKLFTADLSHELRTPLMVISSSCELLSDDPSLAPAHRARLVRALAASGEIHQQLAACLMLSRGSSDAASFAQAEVTAIAREQIEYWAPRAKQLGLRIEGAIDDAGTPPPLPPSFPAALLRIVMSNLLRNALQHASSGTRVVVRARATVFHVSDDGPGIAPEVASHVFMPFVRGEATGAGNLGLGLSLVHRICEHQGWRVTFDTQPGAGTQFHVDLMPG